MLCQDLHSARCWGVRVHPSPSLASSRPPAGASSPVSVTPVGTQKLCVQLAWGPGALGPCAQRRLPGTWAGVTLQPLLLSEDHLTPGHTLDSQVCIK